MIEVQLIEPISELKNYIRKISVFKNPAGSKYLQKLTPSTFTYLSYNHKTVPLSKWGTTRFFPKRRLQIVGPKVRKEIFVEYSGDVVQILFEFTGSGFYYLFKQSPETLVDNILDLDQIESIENAIFLEKQLSISENPTDYIKILERYLIKKIGKTRRQYDYIEEGLKLIEESQGTITVNDIVKEVQKSERQFNRQFTEIVGLSPKCYSKILHLHYIINMINKNLDVPIQEIAYRSNFYDHAHLCRQFKSLTGYTPSEFINTNAHIAFKYFTDLK